MNSSGLQTHESTVVQKLKVIFSRDARGVCSNALPSWGGFSSSGENGLLEITLGFKPLIMFIFSWRRAFLFNGCSRYSLVVHADTD